METLARWGAGLLGLSTTEEQSKAQGTTSTRAAPYMSACTSTQATDTFAHSSQVNGGETDTISGSMPSTQCDTRPRAGRGESDVTRDCSHQRHEDDGGHATLPTEPTEALFNGAIPPWEVAQGFESDSAALEYTKTYAKLVGFKVNKRDGAKVRASYKSGK